MSETHHVEARSPRVAILAVHGVGKHAPGQTQNEIADLLMSLPVSPDSQRSFRPFRSVGIQIPLQPVITGASLPSKRMGRFSKILDVFEERSAKFSSVATQYKSLHGEPSRGELGNDFTKMLLEGYKGGADGNTYITDRLEGARVGNANHAPADVHIYEALWADLASPNNTILSFFLALFQLLLHLGSLSRLDVDMSSARNSGLLWQFYLTMQRYAVRMLQIFLPLLKVILLIVVFSSIPALEKVKEVSNSIPIVLCGIAGFVLSFFLLTRHSRPVTYHPWIWAALAFTPGVAGVIVGVGACYVFNDPIVAGAIASWIILGAPLFYYVLSRYEDVRQGVQITGWTSYGLFFLIFLISLTYADMSVLQATFWVLEVVVAALRLSWFLMFCFASLALSLGSIIWRREQDKVNKARLRAAIRTSRLALALPTFLFMLITGLIMAGMFNIANKLQPCFFPVKVIEHAQPALAWLARFHLVPVPVADSLAFRNDYLQSLLVLSLGYQFPITLALFAAGLFLLVWWALPGALTERFPLRDSKIPPRSSTNAESTRLGTWISRGLDATSAVTFLIWCSIFLVPFIFFLLPDHSVPELLRTWAIRIVRYPQLAFSGVALGILLKYGSPILNLVLDVDNYLRTSPEQATPRAKISERYVSTLRYIAKYRDAAGNRYDRLIIISHSLGTLITADLLRFLHTEIDPDLANLGYAGGKGVIPIQLVTMGSPIRQLLNRFFPYLYDWVRDYPDNGQEPLPAPTSTPPKLTSTPRIPNPSDLGVDFWVNVYRSGDYVGRSLWLNEWYCRTDPSKSDGRYPQEIYVAQDSDRLEACIGAGAHTHYWDDSAPDVAQLLNELI